MVETTGQPVAGVRILGSASYPEGQPAPTPASAVTDATGAYTLSFLEWPKEALGGNAAFLYLTFELPSGFVLVSVTKDLGEVPGAGPGATLDLDDVGTRAIDITLAPGPTLEGKVTNGLTEAPLAGIRVMALRPNSLFIDGSSGDAVEIEAAAMTDATGRYSLTVRSGTYVIDAFDPQAMASMQRFWTDDLAIFQATPLKVDGSVDGIDITLVPVSAITGELRSGSAPVVGGITGVRVVAYQAATDVCCTVVGVAVTDDNSTFLMYIPQGTYRVEFDPPAGSPFAGEWWNEATGFPTATDVEVGSTSVQLVVDLARTSP